MKKLTLFSLVFSLVFASCSSNKDEVIDTTPENLLQSYTLKRDANGAYSIDFNTTENTDVTTVKNIDNSNDIILSETNRKTARTYSNNYKVEEDQLKIGFLDANKGNRTQIAIEDEDIKFYKGGVTEFLNSYSITKNEDGTFTLNFTVNNNVTTEFVYNEEIETYEVHLATGKSKQKEFSRQLEMNTTNLIKLDFVNHMIMSSKSSVTSEYIREKPRVIIGGADII